MRTTYII